MRRDCLPAGFKLGVLPPRSLAVDGSYEAKLRQLQCFRAAVYLEDNAIPSSAVDKDGRHILPYDESQWHLFTTSRDGELNACLRLAKHQYPVPSLTLLQGFKFVSRMDCDCQKRFSEALTAWVNLAFSERVGLGEVGGWAVAAEARRSMRSILLPLAAWSLYRILGHCVVLSSATVRHRSADILKRLGGTSLTSGVDRLPTFHDPHHGCEIEFIVYDSRQPAPAYRKLVDQIYKWLRVSYPWNSWLPRSPGPTMHSFAHGSEDGKENDISVGNASGFG